VNSNYSIGPTKAFAAASSGSLGVGRNEAVMLIAIGQSDGGVLGHHPLPLVNQTKKVNA
jgi:hypothetical protein